MAEIIVTLDPPWELAALIGPAPDEAATEDRQLEFRFTPDMTPSD